MNNTDPKDAVTQWLSTAWPGGQYMVDHWDTGPYWLVPIADQSQVSRPVEVLLNAHEPLATVPVYIGTESHPAAVYAVSDFVCHMLRYHEADHDVQVLSGRIQGPYQDRPTAKDLLDALAGVIAGWHRQGRSHAEDILDLIDELSTADPVTALTALEAADRSVLTWGREGLIETLTTAVALTAENTVAA